MAPISVPLMRRAAMMIATIVLMGARVARYLIEPGLRIILRISARCASSAEI
jgi:hypothetical protein